MDRHRRIRADRRNHQAGRWANSRLVAGVARARRRRWPLKRDLRLAARNVRKARGLSLVIIASIAIGIGVNTTVFSWIEARVLRPLPGVDRGADFLLVEARGENGSFPGMSWLEYRDLRDRLSSFRSLIAFRMAPLSVGGADWSERSYGVLVSAN